MLAVVAMFGMFEDLGMISRWRIARDSLARFILLVRRGYRSPPYHNWCHGFTVAHFVYLVLQNSSLLARGLLRDCTTSFTTLLRCAATTCIRA